MPVFFFVNKQGWQQLATSKKNMLTRQIHKFYLVAVVELLIMSFISRWRNSMYESLPLQNKKTVSAFLSADWFNILQEVMEQGAATMSSRQQAALTPPLVLLYGKLFTPCAA